MHSRPQSRRDDTDRVPMCDADSRFSERRANMSDKEENKKKPTNWVAVLIIVVVGGAILDFLSKYGGVH